MQHLFKQVIALSAAVLGMYLNWTVVHSTLFGIVVLGLYFFIVSDAYSAVVRKTINAGVVWNKAYGFLISFYLSAMAAGIPVVLWKYHRPTIALALWIAGCTGIFLSYRYRNKTKKTSEPIAYQHVARSVVREYMRDQSLWVLVLLSSLFVFFIIHARTGVYILSPWDALSSFVLMLFFGITFLVVRAVFSKHPKQVILIILISFSYVAHLYLPGVYETGFGGDKWRHLGAEQWLAEGNVYTPSIWGEDAPLVHFGPVALPEALVAGNKTSYAAQWSSTIFISETLAVDMFWVDLLMVYILWSLFITIILYHFGSIIFKDARLGLLFAFLPTLFYTFQSEGAITIPVSFGHLFFFFVFLLWMHYAQTGRRASFKAAALFTFLFYWNYILNFFVLIGIGVLSVAWRALFVNRLHWGRLRRKHRLSERRIQIRDRFIFTGLVIVSVLAIPFLEIFQGLSTLAPHSLSGSGVVDAFADAFGRLSGFIGIVVPPDFIDQGNFLYNQTKLSLSRIPLFSYRVVPFVVSMAVWGCIVFMLYRLFRYKKSEKTITLVATLFLITLSSYFISWSFTDGIHILARRLNETIVFFMILFLGSAIWHFVYHASVAIPRRKRIIAVSFLLAFAATSTFASGPKLQLVTADEIAAARLVWSEHQFDEGPYCVIGNTWPLLGLEAISGRHITAGNFPVYAEYAQPERVKIFEGMSKSPSETWIAGAFRVTGASVCYYMTENRWINDRILESTVTLLGEPRRTGDVYIWRIEKSFLE